MVNKEFLMKVIFITNKILVVNIKLMKNSIFTTNLYSPQTYIHHKLIFTTSIFLVVNIEILMSIILTTSKTFVVNITHLLHSFCFLEYFFMFSMMFFKNKWKKHWRFIFDWICASCIWGKTVDANHITFNLLNLQNEACFICGLQTQSRF